jgi:hypothetical protein
MRSPLRTLWIAALAVATIGLATPVLADAHAGRSASGSGGAPTIVQLEDARLKFEINATDGDGGIQAFIDAEQWDRMSIYDRGGNRIFTATAEGRMAKQGSSELFMESGEPTFEDLSLRELLERWPEGTYEFRGHGIHGETFVGSARLTHNLPRGPRLVSPLENDGLQDPANTALHWVGVPAPNGSPIIGYEVIVEQPETGRKALPTRTLDVMLSANARSLAVPRVFLRHDTEYDWEVLAIEASGNQTLSSATFTTS